MRTVHDRIAGTFEIPGMPIRTSDYPAHPDYSAPTLGEHNVSVLRELLDYDTEAIASLQADGVLAEGDV